jgi:hypothetical protein
MTDREYFEQKKEAFYNKIGDWFDKHLNFIYLFCLVVEVLSFVCVWKLNIMFLVLLIPWTLFCFGFTWGMVELWLDKEHKENK